MRVVRPFRSKSFATEHFDSAFGEICEYACLIAVLLFGLLFWTTHILAFVPFTLVEARAFWLEPQGSQPPLFQLFSLCCALLIAWTIAIALRSSVARKNDGSGTMVVLFFCVFTLTAIGGVLYKMRTSVLDDSWYSWALANEELKSERYYIGRIVERSLRQCGNVPEPCAAVELLGGEIVTAHLPDLPNPWSTDVISANLMIGGLTGRRAYFEVTDYIAGDPVMRARWFEE